MKQQKTRIFLTASLLVLLGVLSFNLNANAQIFTQHRTTDDAKQSAGKGVKDFDKLWKSFPKN